MTNTVATQKRGRDSRYFSMSDFSNLNVSSTTTARLPLRAVLALLTTLVLLSLPGGVLAMFAEWLPFTSAMPSGAGFPTDKLVHTLMFAGCTWAVLEAWQSKPLLLLALLVLFAVVTEIIQVFVPGRSASFLDLVADGVGIALVYGVQIVLGRCRVGQS